MLLITKELSAQVKITIYHDFRLYLFLVVYQCSMICTFVRAK